MPVQLQKASISKRIAAALLDFMLLIVIITGAATLFANIFGYEANLNTLENREKYFEAEYGIDFRITSEQYDALTEEQRQNYDAAMEALLGDEEYSRLWYKQFSLILQIATFSILLGILVVEFVIPLFLKNGQTVGKKVFSLALVQTDCVQATKMQIFVRAILGKFTIETMIPVYILIMLYFATANIVHLAILAGLLIGQIVSIAVSKTNAAIHDLMAGTVVVDMPSQHIFQTKEDLLEHTKKIHAEQANRSDYK